MSKTNYIKKDETIACKECKCLVLKDDAKEVQVVSLGFDGFSMYSRTIELNSIYYCQQHAPDYNLKIGDKIFKAKLEEIPNPPQEP